MKKLLVLLLVIALIGLFAGCTISNDEVSANGLDGSVLQFTTTTLDGETVTEEIFSDYDLTMINIWASWCPGCVEEMPELAQLYDQLPQDVNLLTLTVDSQGDLPLAQDIVDSVEAQFMTLTYSEDLGESLLAKIDLVPSSVFVDSSGVIVGEPLVGAPGKGEELVENYLLEIENRLADE